MIQMAWVNVFISNNGHVDTTITYPNSFTMSQAIGVVSQNGTNYQLTMSAGNSSLWFGAHGGDTRSVRYNFIMIGY